MSKTAAEPNAPTHADTARDAGDPTAPAFRCNICGGTRIGETVERVDGVAVAFCADCTMGSIHPVPDDLSHFYLEDYYAIEEGKADGYEDYAFTAEHGTAWAAAMLEAFDRVGEGSILDIGCANGHLLAKLCPPLRGFGIEANPEAAEEARAQRVEMLGADLADPALAEWEGRFDVVTSIATFEHLADFRGGVERALSLMKPDGLLLFEVPLISATHPNGMWYRSSLEHVFYPTATALRRLFDDEIDVPMLGVEMVVPGFASLYIGVAVRDRAALEALAPIWDRLTDTDPADQPSTPAEWRARTLLHLIHAARIRPAEVEGLAHLRPGSVNAALLQRIAALWTNQARQNGHMTRKIADLTNAKTWHEEQAARWEAAAKQTTETTEEPPRPRAGAVGRARTWAASLIDRSAPVDDVSTSGLNAGPRAMGLDLSYLVRRTAWVLEREGSRTLRRLKGRPPRPPEHPRFLAQPIRQVAQSRHRDGPLVSIVIPCFNYGQFVGEAVASARAQTFGDIEIIVVDGGSTDGTTPRIVRDLAGGNVTVHLRKGRHQVGSNRNYGIARAGGRYICCLDADDVLPATYIEKAVFMAEFFGFDVVGGSVQMFGARDNVWRVPETVDLSRLLDHGNGIATNAVFRRDVWEGSGGFRDHGDGSPMTHLHEDYEFWIRLAARGARFHNMTSEAGLLYRIHGPESLSSREGIRGHRDQIRAIVEANPGTDTKRTRQRSGRLRRRPLRVVNPLVNLTPGPRRPDPKSLIVALPFMLIGGAERLLSGLLARMAADGWRIAIVTTLVPHPSDGNTRHWFEQATPDIFDLPSFLPDRSRWPDFLDYLIASRAASRVMIVGSAFLYDQLPRLSDRWPDLKVCPLLFNTVGHTARHLKYARHVDITLVENGEVRDWLVEHGEDPTRIEAIPSGVDLTHHRPQASSPLRGRIGAGPGDVIVGFSGRWSVEKNPLGFIQIASALRDEGNVHFVMTGAGKMADEVQAAFEASGLSDARFHILGAVDDLGEVLPGYDVLVVPSTLDGRPVVILEALAAGVPVVASRIGGIPELVIPGLNGALCDPGDVEGFVQAIRDLTGDPERLAAAKAAARTFAEENLDEHSMTAHYIRALSRE